MDRRCTAAPVALANSANLEDLYTYDGVNQLKPRDRGALNANKDAVTSKNFAEDWTLDMTGNWPTFKQDTDGNGTWDLDQSRTHDKANQITEIASSSDHVAEDRAGNMTKVPKPDNWSAHYDLTYDAWHRLVKVMDGEETTVAQYAYDGRNFRTTKAVSGTTRHYYFSSDWQVLEERIGDSAYANRQFIWGLRFMDDLVLRDRNADADTGTGNLGLSGSGLEERLYSLQDPNWNAAVAATDGTIQERHAYTVYGKPTFLSAAFGNPSTSSNYAWDTLFTGRQYDPETGIYYYRNRYYGAEVGRFLSRDPIGYGGGIDLYQYVRGNPLTRTDPIGYKDAACKPVGPPVPLGIFKPLRIWVTGKDDVAGGATGLKAVQIHCFGKRTMRQKYKCCDGSTKFVDKFEFKLMTADTLNRHIGVIRFVTFDKYFNWFESDVYYLIDPASMDEARDACIHVMNDR